MLDSSALQQLKQFKQELDQQKQRCSGVVIATTGRHGFVQTTDNERFYLSADEMQKLLPGDEIDVVVEQPKEGKKFALVEKFKRSNLTTFTGRYRLKNNHHFVEPDLPNYSRWLFVPGSERKKAKEGDYVSCQILRHPYKNQGKPQVKILESIGSSEQAFVERDYVCTKYQIQTSWPENWQDELKLQSDFTENRQDLRDKSFVSIDGAATRDVDDALYAEKTGTGWRLFVAIADPSHYVLPNSAIDKLALSRGGSVYFPGHAIGMLPEQLVEENSALLPDEDRPALVCTIDIDQHGNVSEYAFSLAVVRSKAKLSYQEVAASLQENGTALTDQEIINSLFSLSTALLKARSEEALVMEDQNDFALFLDDNGQLAQIRALQKTDAHRLVEECMIVANRCAADFLQDDQALFITHPGFRKERQKDLNKLLEEYLPNKLQDAIDTLSGYRDTIRAFAEDGSEIPLRKIARRSLERSRLSKTAAPHFGMGLKHYTTFTSPLRKYSDLVVHRCIKAKLQQQALPEIPDVLIETLQASQTNKNQASYEYEMRLKCDFLAKQPTQVWEATISSIHSRGMTLSLVENGIEGQITTKDLGEKFRFDSMHMCLSSKTRRFQLGQRLPIEVASTDSDRRTIRFRLAASDTQQES